MMHFFRQAGGDLFDGSPAYLDSLKGNFSADQATGLIEVQTGPAEQVFLLFAGGALTGAYRNGPEACLPIREHEASLGWSAENAPIRLLTLSDAAGRAIWLALESRPRDRREVQGAAGWTEFLDECRTRQFTGQVHAVSDTCDGLLLFRDGVPVPSEMIFCTPSGFESSPVRLSACLGSSIQLTLSELDPTRPAAQYCELRLGAADWGKTLLERYREMVGQRLLQTLADDLNAIIRGWRWKIRLNGSDLLDQHFFSQQKLASQAYFTIFKGITDRIQVVLGGLLAGRMMSETFETLESPQRQSLSALNLTPAALAQ
jgi:hypothetical protein